MRFHEWIGDPERAKKFWFRAVLLFIVPVTLLTLVIAASAVAMTDSTWGAVLVAPLIAMTATFAISCIAFLAVVAEW